VNKYEELGDEFFNNGNYSKAMVYYKKGTAIDENNAVLKKKTEDCNMRIEESKITVSAKMVYVKGGWFEMGADDGYTINANPNSHEGPIHKVYLNDFYIRNYEVTFAEYDKFCEATGRRKPEDKSWGRGNRPVINVSWHDATAYCEWLSIQTGKSYRLPTEAEWEYAARGGNKSRGFEYSGSNNINEVAWYSNNSNDKTHPVGTKQQNELGIYDMSGNVNEWCNDWYSDDYYSRSPDRNPTGPLKGNSNYNRIIRGGSWLENEIECRVTWREFCSRQYENTGFRYVQDL